VVAVTWLADDEGEKEHAYTLHDKER